MALLRSRREKNGLFCTYTGLERFMTGLPFSLTGAQTRVLSEIASDVASGRPMNRLVQGDVGSGKTVVAPPRRIWPCKSGVPERQ